MKEGGFFKLWRGLLDSAIFSDPELLQMWVYCIGRANYTARQALIPNTTERIEIPRGSFITTRSDLHKAITKDGPKRSAMTVWRKLIALEGMGCVNLENLNNHGTKVTVCNYETYQSPDFERDQPVISRRSAGDQPTPKAPLEEERREEGKEGGAAAKNEAQAGHLSNPPAPESGEWNPATLAVSWIFYRKGTRAREELANARSTFEEMLRLGCQAAQIAAEIANGGRDRTETLWRFHERVMRSVGLWKGNGRGQADADQFSSLKRFVERHGDAAG